MSTKEDGRKGKLTCRQQFVLRSLGCLLSLQGSVSQACVCIDDCTSSSAFPAISLGFTTFGEIFACVTVSSTNLIKQKVFGRVATRMALLNHWYDTIRISASSSAFPAMLDFQSSE